ncbi:MAG: hypothetical protein AAB733_01970 [Patescibacteria group bacterium]
MISLPVLQITLTLVTAANVLLGFLVFFRGKSTTEHRWFIAFITSSTFLSLTNLLVRMVPYPELERLTYLAGVFLAATGLIWIHALIGKPLSKKSIGVLAVITLLLCISTLSNLFLSEIHTYDRIIFQADVGILYFPYLIVQILNLLYILFRLIRYNSQTSGLKKSQIQYILIGIILYGTTAITFGILSPAFNLRNHYYVVAPSSLFFIAITTYAILKHRLFGLVFLIRRAAVATGIIISLSALYLALNLLFSLWLSTVISPAIAMVIAVVLSVLFYPLLYPQFQRWIPKILFPSQYTIEERDLHLKQLLIHSPNLRKISTQLQSYLVQHFQATHVEIYFLKKRHKRIGLWIPICRFFTNATNPWHGSAKTARHSLT